MGALKHEAGTEARTAIRIVQEYAAQDRRNRQGWRVLKGSNPLPSAWRPRGRSGPAGPTSARQQPRAPSAAARPPAGEAVDDRTAASGRLAASRVGAASAQELGLLRVELLRGQDAGVAQGGELLEMGDLVVHRRFVGR